jgi:hypothetical protein
MHVLLFLQRSRSNIVFSLSHKKFKIKSELMKKLGSQLQHVL